MNPQELPRRAGVRVGDTTSFAIERVTKALANVVAPRRLATAGPHELLSKLADIVRAASGSRRKDHVFAVLAAVENELARSDLDPEFENAVSMSFLYARELCELAGPRLPEFARTHSLIGSYEQRMADLDPGQGRQTRDTPMREWQDAWYRGQSIPGVVHLLNDVVEITLGPDSGASGFIISIEGLEPEPTYLVELESGGGDRIVAQSALRPVD